MARKSISGVKVELSDDTGFGDVSGCHEFKGDVEHHITQDDVRFSLESRTWFLITTLGDHKSKNKLSITSETLTFF